MKIKRFQTGGIVYTPFIPNVGSSTKSSSSTTEVSDDPGTFTKEIIDIIQETGLPNDVDSFLSEANSFLNNSKSLTNYSSFGGTGEHSLSDMLKVQSMANKVKFNKGLYDSASSHLTKEGAWSEVATDNRGNMYVYSDKGIELVSPTEYHKQRDNYKVLTNSQLLSLRENQSNLAYNQSILNDMSGSVGMQTVTNYIKGVVQNFGTSQLDGYVSKSKDKVANGLQEIMMGGPDGVYKYTLKSQVDKNDDSDVNFALNYLYSTLPENMKSLLRAKSAAEGLDPNSKEARQKLLYMALMEHTSETISADFDSSATEEASGGSSGSGSTTLVEKNYLEEVAGVASTNIQEYQIAPEGSKMTLNAKGQDLATLITRTGDIVPQNNLAALYGMVKGEEAAYAFSVADRSSTYFGGKVIPQQDLNKLVWDGSNLTKIWLPYTTDNQGHKVPDFELQQKVDEVATYLADHPGMADMQIRQLVDTTLQGKAYWDPDTDDIKINPDNMMGFLSISVYAGKDSVDFDTDSPYIAKVSRQEGKQITDLYDNYIQFNGPIAGKNADKNIGTNTSTRGDFYKGNIFVPTDNMGAGVILGGKAMLPKNAYTNIQQKIQTRADNKRMITTW